jgi:hypothetical protein
MACQIPTLQQNFKQNYWVTLVTELQFSHSAVEYHVLKCLQLNAVCVLDSLEKFMWPTNVLSQTALTLILTFLQKKAFLISYLLDKYRSFLPNDVPDTYPSAKFQAK